MDKKTHIHVWYVTGAILLMLVDPEPLSGSTKSTAIPYSRFQTLLVPAIFFVGIWMFAIRPMGQGGLAG